MDCRLMLAAAALTLPLAAVSPQSEQVLQAGNAWFEAMRAGNSEAISGCLSDEFTGLTALGRKFNRSEWAAQFSSAWSRPFRNFSVEQQQVRVYGELAVVTGMIRYPRNQVVYTHVWLRKDAKWRLIALHESPVVLSARK
jgi:ketosteroid isomerase-like protein